MSCAAESDGAAARVGEADLDGVDVGAAPRRAAQVRGPVARSPVGVVSPSTGMVTVVTPWASVVNADSAMRRRLRVTAPEVPAAQVSSNAERVVSRWYTVTVSARARVGARARGPAVPW